ncbi:MAG: right-handed parallel beta-helix repeat-containing protein [Planctomycetota bacterium]|jgi:hypothetical protein
MYRITILLQAFLIFCGLGCSSGYYVALNGDDSNAGTRGDAFRSIEKAIEVVEAGESIFIRGGTYYFTDEIEIEKDGIKGKPIKLWACPDEEVVLDFSKAGDSSNGFDIEGSYWHFKGLVIQKAGEKGIACEGSHNVFERLVTCTNGDGGLKLDDGAAYNMVLNCDSYLNYDKAGHGSDADGFAAKHGLGEGNSFKGCRAWNNSDDGFDFMEAGKAIRVERCWSWGNGHNLWNDPEFDGNGVGFKLGDGPGEHYIIRCLVWKNAKSGFNIQGNTSSVKLYNNTAWDNNRNYFFDEHRPHKLRNNVSLEGKVVMFDEVDDKNNSWNSKLVIGRDDFLSLDDSGMNGPRNRDGSLKESDFLKLAAGSDLIDAGVDVGLGFCGSSPDLGVYESPELQK